MDSTRPADPGSGAPAEDGVLAGTTVVDVTSDVAGGFAGKLLADLGATVVMVEPAGGSPLRRVTPAPPKGSHGALFAFLAGGKLSVDAADWGDNLSAGLARLVGDADVVLRDGTSSLDHLLPDPLPGHVVEVDFAPFGRGERYSGWRASDIALWAMGGYMSFVGDAERRPVWIPGSQAQLHGAVHGAFATLVALHERRTSGLGQRVEVRTLDAVLGSHSWLASRWAANGAVMPRTGPGLTATSDGWVIGLVPVWPMDPSAAAVELAGRADLVAGLDTDEGRAQATKAIDEWAAGLTAMEIFEAAHKAGLNLTPVLDAAGVATSEQLAARSWWEPEEDPAYTRLAFPGQPFRLTAAPARRRGPAPLLGQHSHVIATSPPHPAPATPRRPASANPVDASGGPLAGMRVVEVATNWAAPVCARHLADLGAEVVKVEWASRLATRIEVIPGSPPDPLTQAYNRSLYFNELNRNKREVALDLSTPAGATVFKELVREADVLVENNSARVMPKLGLGYDVLSALNPRLVMVSMTAFGADGPWRDRRGGGPNFESVSGLISVIGYDPAQPYRTSMFYGDPIGGEFGAVAVMAGLAHRSRTGRGQWIDMSLTECATLFFSDLLMAYLANGEIRRPMGNRDPRWAPQGAYRCAGWDNWVVVCVQSDEEWDRLAVEIGRPEWAGPSGIVGLDERRRRHDEIDDALEAWTAGQEQHHVAHQLQAIGVSAAPVLANWQILADPHIHASGFYQPVEHPAVGVYPQASWPWRFSRTPASIRRPAPTFAQHNAEIFADLGLDQDTVGDLYASGATADVPTPEAASRMFASTIRPPAPPDHTVGR